MQIIQKGMIRLKKAELAPAGIFLLYGLISNRN